MKEHLLADVKKKVFDFSGIIISAPQKDTLVKFIKTKAKENGETIEEFCQNLKPGTSIMDELINLVTVNETYFFREQKQFDFLAEQIFPKFMGKKINIWSGACSTGEEAISLLAMALSFGLDATVYATDIDDQVIAFLKRGEYSSFSFRKDGSKYHNLLDPYITQSGRKFVFNSAFIDRIKVYKCNLTSDEDFPFPEKMDIVFLRNVFIYFDIDTRHKVCEKICNRINPEGLLFFSMNEVGCVDYRILPKDMMKVNHKEVYYFINKKAYESYSSLNLITNISEIADKPKENKLAAIIAAKSADRKAKTTVQRKPVAVVPTVTTKIFDVQKEFNAICESINRKDFVNARTLVSKITGIENTVYKYFFSGYVEYHDDNKAEAEKLFSSAEIIKQNFWPAYFYHGLVLKDIGKDEKSKFCFKKCKEILDDLKGSNPYNFVLDSFSPSYIYNLCTTLQKA